jgi:CHAT domain-containing protein/tetratricopeptide (TPR) repeat protein
MAPSALISAVCAGLLLAACSNPGSRANYQRANQALNRGQFEIARAAAERGYKALSGQPQSAEYWQFRLLMAEALIELDRRDEAEALLRTGAPRAEDNGRRLADLAMVHFRNREPVLPADDVAKARAVLPHAGGELAAKIDVIEAMIETRDSHFEKADALLRPALKSMENSNSLIEAYALVDLGMVVENLFRYDEAMYWSRRAHDMAVSKGLQRPAELALINLGAALLFLGDNERAVEQLEQAATLATTLNDPVYKVTILTLLGEAWSASGNLTKAAEYYQKAQTLANPEINPQPLAEVLDDLARISLKQGDVDGAAALNQRGLDASRPLKVKATQRSLELELGDIAMARRDFSQAQKIYALTLQEGAADGDPDVMFQSHAGLAAAYRAQINAPMAAAEFRAGAGLIDSERAKLTLDESKFSFLAHLMDFYRNYVDFLMDRGDRDGAFRVAESCRARVLEERLARSGKGDLAGDVKALKTSARATGTTLLSYWLAPHRSLVWVIDGKGLNVHILPGEEEIARRVQRFREEVEQGEKSPAGDAAGEWLFANLVEKWAPKGDVVIEPDGALHQLNFEALPSGGGHYWIEDATVAIAPSLSVLREYAPEKERRLLAFGDPGFAGTEFSQLAGLRAELAAVAKHFDDPKVYSGQAATPAAYGAAGVEQFTVLHFATHAVANRESPLDSAIILAGPPAQRKLYARDILKQPLDAELVTLSACQTAGSRAYRGEGWTGFSWAFLSAGARNVVAGLWDVDDRATEQLMGQFYDQLANGLPPAAALRRAKLALLAGGGRYAKPRYWAAFETFTKALY